MDFPGRSFDTGTLCNVLFSRGIIAPHTGNPYSEALLLGVSGGIAFAYMVFQYKGWPAHVSLLTRNTFQPPPWSNGWALFKKTRRLPIPSGRTPI